MATTITDRFGNSSPTGSIITTPLIGTSTSSHTVSTSSGLSFDVQANRAWKPGTRLRVSSTDATKIMEGEVQTYTGSTALVLEVDYTEGSGSTDSWSVGVAGVRGIQGSSGDTGSSGADGMGVEPGAANQVAVYTSTSMVGSSSGLRYSGGALSVGSSGSTAGSIVLASTGGGNTTLRGSTAAVAYTLALPSSLGSTGQALLLNSILGSAGFLGFGAASGSGINSIASRTFSTSASYNPSTFVQYVLAIATGGGGSGGAGSGFSGAGGGGGAGETRITVVEAGSLGSTETVTVGAGGAGVASGAGNNGGNTAFGAHATANGGSGGSAASGTTAGAGGVGGTGGSGGFQVLGGSGDSGGTGNTTDVTGTGGAGGASFWGGGGTGGRSGGSGVSGSTGRAYGSGSGGGSGDNGSGPGKDGAVYLLEFRSS